MKLYNVNVVSGKTIGDILLTALFHEKGSCKKTATALLVTTPYNIFERQFEAASGEL